MAKTTKKRSRRARRPLEIGDPATSADAEELTRMRKQRERLVEFPWLWAVRSEWDFSTAQIILIELGGENASLDAPRDGKRLGYRVWIRWTAGWEEGMAKVPTPPAGFTLAKQILAVAKTKGALINIVFSQGREVWVYYAPDGSTLEEALAKYMPKRKKARK